MKAATVIAMTAMFSKVMSLLLILYYHISYSEIKKNDSNLVKNIKYRISNIQALMINTVLIE